MNISTQNLELDQLSDDALDEVAGGRNVGRIGIEPLPTPGPAAFRRRAFIRLGGLTGGMPRSRKVPNPDKYPDPDKYPNPQK